MLQQYFRARAEHPGVLLAMRVGDFYEFYGPDAEVAAAELEITLTGREDGANGRVPMAGVPFHSVEKYLARLLRKGHKVALCDQVEDPKAAKGLVRRQVTRVLTPGTLVEASMLESGVNNFLCALALGSGRWGLATLDLSTGELLTTEIEDESGARLAAELARLRPAELLASSEAQTLEALRALELNVTESMPISFEEAERTLLAHFGVQSLEAFGCSHLPAAQAAAATVLVYAQKNGLALGHVEALATYSVGTYMMLDPVARRSLELTQNLSDGGRQFTLLDVLDCSRTPMGSRCLRRFIEQPLLDREQIEDRLEAVDLLRKEAITRGDLREQLRGVSDLERLVSRCCAGAASPRDLGALRATLLQLPDLRATWLDVSRKRLHELRERTSAHEQLAEFLRKAIVPDPPHAFKEGGYIAEGFDLELDKLRAMAREGRSYIAGLEASERARTGIGNLKVGFNAVFGYYMELPKQHADKAPADYVRKQTTATSERYITAALKEHESAVLGAQEKAAALELDIFARLRNRVAEASGQLLQTSRAIAELDALCSFAEVAAERGYCRPEISERDELHIEAGRHPIVEAFQRAFVPNDLGLQPAGEGERLLVITGPNMSGKSTFLRQTALIALMAQVGSFVPAKACRLRPCDRIFSRIGARDQLASGHSTFMVEMLESACILNHATEASLVILDEVGRGTSTYDGLAIAWAMTERLAGIGCKALFATHYHQLNTLANQLAGVANYRASVLERKGEIVWTYKLLPGGTDRSYGIHVARMAGMPPSVLGRAAEVLAELEGSGAAMQAPSSSVRKLQLTLFEDAPAPIVGELGELDADSLSPREALELIYDWKRRFAAAGADRS